MVIKHGTTRIVILIGRWAIKIPSFVQWNLFLCGLLGNMQEAVFSATGWPKLCPVCFACPGGWFIVMKRAEPLPREQFFAMDYDAWKNVDEYIVPVENKLDSFGLLNGQVVAVDYGSRH